jgi:hypothetical protein
MDIHKGVEALKFPAFLFHFVHPFPESLDTLGLTAGYPLMLTIFMSKVISDWFNSTYDNFLNP